MVWKISRSGLGPASAAITLLCLIPAVSLARPFTLGDAALAPEDVERVQAANREVLEVGSVGATREWTNPRTQSRGGSRILRLYDKDDTPCAVVEIVYEVERNSQRWVFHYCRQPDGNWKISD